MALSTRFFPVWSTCRWSFSFYIAGNLTRFMYPLWGTHAPLAGRSVVVRGVASVMGLLLPYLEAFDLRPLTVYSTNASLWKIWAIWRFPPVTPSPIRCSP